jgi:hypothetical protein
MFRSCIQQGLPFSACKLWWEFFSYQGSSCYLAAHRVIFLFLILVSVPFPDSHVVSASNSMIYWTMIDHLILVLFLMFLSHWFLQTLYQILQHLYHRYPILSTENTIFESSYHLYETDPSCYSKASTIDPQWSNAMGAWIWALLSNGTWYLCPRPLNHNIIHNILVYKIKQKSNRLVERFKAKLVTHRLHINFRTYD